MGRVDATTWPVQPQQAIDIYFDGKDATYPAGYYRGVIDTATTPSKTGIQKLRGSALYAGWNSI